MATETLTRSDPVADDQRVAMPNIGWRGYSALLKLRGDRGVPRMVYLDGELLLMSPSLSHEHLKSRLGQFVREVAVGLDVDCRPTSQTTFRRRSRRGGVEGDETFYLANEARIRGKTAIDLRVDPPPDLAIEAVFSHDADAAIEVYRRFGVPEVWVCDPFGLTILVRQPDGRYAESPASAAFPFLTADEVSEWVHRPQVSSETGWRRDLRRWVAEALPARREDRP